MSRAEQPSTCCIRNVTCFCILLLIANVMLTRNVTSRWFLYRSKYKRTFTELIKSGLRNRWRFGLDRQNWIHGYPKKAQLAGGQMIIRQTQIERVTKCTYLYQWDHSIKLKRRIEIARTKFIFRSILCRKRDQNLTPCLEETVDRLESKTLGVLNNKIGAL